MGGGGGGSRSGSRYRGKGMNREVDKSEVEEFLNNEYITIRDRA